MIIVYYFDSSASLPLLSGPDLANRAAQQWLAGAYRPVAAVATDDLGDAWKLLQNGAVSESWSREPPAGVLPIEPTYHLTRAGQRLGRRSSMIGDIYEVNGDRYVVDSFGFTECEAAPRAVPADQN